MSAKLTPNSLKSPGLLDREITTPMVSSPIANNKSPKSADKFICTSRKGCEPSSNKVKYHIQLNQSIFYVSVNRHRWVTKCGQVHAL